jgi:hypothetical protein
VLEWGGLSRSSAAWQPRWAALHRGLLYLLPDQDAAAPVATHNIWRNRRAHTSQLLFRTHTILFGPPVHHGSSLQSWQ